METSAGFPPPPSPYIFYSFSESLIKVIKKESFVSYNKTGRKEAKGLKKLQLNKIKYLI
jgi:hypothetical protein